jgi:hypothetical protein
LGFFFFEKEKATEKCYKVPAMPLLFLAREKNPDSFFHKDFMPLDIFKLIYKLTRQVCREHEAYQVEKSTLRL